MLEHGRGEFPGELVCSRRILELKDFDFLAVVTSQTFNADGVMFEYTQSRHRPDYFCFQDTAVRRKPPAGGTSQKLA